MSIRRWTRREVLGAGGAAVAMRAMGGEIDPLSGDALYRDVVHYTEMGGHRTGSNVDMKTSAWLHSELSKAGLRAEYLECKPRRVFDLKTCRVEAGGKRFQADPEWFPTATGPNGVKGALALLGEGDGLEFLKGKIWVLEDPKGGISLDNAIRERIDHAGKAGALAAVVAIRTASGELLGRSAPPARNETAWCSIPLVGVAYKDKDALFAEAAAGARATVVVDGEDRAAVRPRNVMAKYGDGKDLIVVTTPISALTQSGGERGPGVALFLGLARWLGTRKPACRYIFSGNTGHETQGTGAYAFLDTLPPPNEMRAWLHMGACISNRFPTVGGRILEGEAVRRRAGTPAFVAAPSLIPALEKAFASIPDLKPRTDQPGGELQEYLRRGFPAYGFFGTSRTFHTWGDTADASSAELLDPMGRALRRSLELIETA